MSAKYTECRRLAAALVARFRRYPDDDDDLNADRFDELDDDFNDDYFDPEPTDGSIDDDFEFDDPPEEIEPSSDEQFDDDWD